jgi:DNA-binding SARP family transcriptional activator
MHAENSPAVDLHLLSGFTLRVNGDRVSLIWSAQRLIVFLALERRPVNRAYVAETLWPETTTTKAAANLRSALWRAQRSCQRTVDSTAKQLLLDAEVTIDVRHAQERAHRLLDRGTPCNDLLGPDTCAELSSDLLPDWYDDWLLAERERHHQLRLHALEALCERLSMAGRHGESVVAGLAAVHAEPLRESAHKTLIQAHISAGNRWEAVRQYEKCRRILHQELDLEPSPELQRLLPQN